MNEKRYYSAGEYFKKLFGVKIIKIAVDGGFSCPNRDGMISRGGCIFCSESGSGDFAGDRNMTITEQLEQMKAIMNKKWKSGLYMPYFQAFTNTYAPVGQLRNKYYEALNLPGTAAISIATRPDCINGEVLELLQEINKDKKVFVELGLQTSNECLAKFINRGYKNETYERAVYMLKESGIEVITHIILGLPTDTFDVMLQSAQYSVACGSDGIKLQLLHILKNTPLYDFYTKKPFKVMTLDEYADTVISIIERLPRRTVIHRITGDGSRKLLEAPLWSIDKKKVLNTINKRFIERNTWQGRLC